MSEQENEIRHTILLALRSGCALSVSDIFPNPKPVHYKVMGDLNKDDIVASEPGRKYILR